jgi:hypothetical protein
MRIPANGSVHAWHRRCERLVQIAAIMQGGTQFRLREQLALAAAIPH